jgi:hypothetical protein
MGLRPAPMLLFAAALMTGAQAHGQGEPPAAPPATPVAFEVNVCLASQPEGEVDPECRSMQSQLPVRFGTLKVQQRRNLNVVFGEPGGVELPTGSTVEFRPISIVESQLHMQLEMPGVMNTRLRLQSGRSVILAGERHGNGYLIIEVKPTFAAPPPNPPIFVEERAPRRPTSPERRTLTPEAERVGATRTSPR